MRRRRARFERCPRPLDSCGLAEDPKLTLILRSSDLSPKPVGMTFSEAGLKQYYALFCALTIGAKMNGLQFTDEAARQLEKAYLSRDVIAQRSETIGTSV